MCHLKEGQQTGALSVQTEAAHMESTAKWAPLSSSFRTCTILSGSSVFTSGGANGREASCSRYLSLISPFIRVPGFILDSLTHGGFSNCRPEKFEFFRRVSPKPHLVYKPWKLTVHPRLHNPFKRRLYRQNWSGKKWKDVRSIFDVIRDGDLLVHHPYQSFSSSTQRFVEEAARVLSTSHVAYLAFLLILTRHLFL
jgi:hypothetical protein